MSEVREKVDTNRRKSVWQELLVFCAGPSFEYSAREDILGLLANRGVGVMKRPGQRIVHGRQVGMCGEPEHCLYAHVVVRVACEEDNSWSGLLTDGVENHKCSRGWKGAKSACGFRELWDDRARVRTEAVQHSLSVVSKYVFPAYEAGKPGSTFQLGGQVIVKGDGSVLCRVVGETVNEQVKVVCSENDERFLPFRSRVAGEPVSYGESLEPRLASSHGNDENDACEDQQYRCSEYKRSPTAPHVQSMA
jgi:hypothetical protein